MPSLAGQQLDKYQMLEEVGHGGMAVVYRCMDTVLDREVAVKVLHPHLADREESRARLRREAITVAKLRHDNILEIFDYSGTTADESYIVTEFIHGVTLRDWLDSRWQPRPAVAAMIVHRLCLALAHAHEFGVVHRDIKPENVMIREDGCLKLMDFGIAQILDHQKLTMTGQLLGSPAYMAPELISGKPIDSRTDLFSVGILLYQLATGKLPFSGRNPHEVLNRIADADYAPASSVNPMVDEDLEDLLKRALAREPDHRYQTARALANDLEDYLQAMGVEPAPEELRAYFKNAEQYVDELDERVCAHLLEKAEKANREGHSARSLKLLSRVIELDPDNKRATELLDTVRRRGRVMRQALMGFAAVAVLGLVGAGVLLMKPEPPKAAVIEDQDKAPDTEKAAVIPVQQPEQEPRVVEPPDNDSDTGEANVETGEPEIEPAGTPNRVRRDTSYNCKITVSGLPKARITEFTLTAGTNKPVNLDSNGTATVPIAAAGTSVKLNAPRYTWHENVNPKRCAKNTLKVPARPKPAVLTFSDLPNDLRKGDKLTVKCIKECRFEGLYRNFKRHQHKIAQSEHKVTIEVLLKAEGYADNTKSFTLIPGENSKRAGMKPSG